jgi:hypothetical protein
MRAITVLANIAFIASIVLFTIVFLGLGILLVVFPFEKFSVDAILDQHVMIWRIVGVLMILAFINYLISMWLRTRHEDCIAFDNPEGEVIIAVHAVEDSVRRLVEAFPEVRSASPNVVGRNDGVDVEVKVTLWDDSNVHSSSERIQSATKGHIQSYFGLANVNTVKIFISGTSARGGSQSRMDFDEAETPDEGRQDNMTNG